MRGKAATRAASCLTSHAGFLLPPCRPPQVTDRMEWYYRGVHPCEHYLPFWVHNETDVVQLVRALQGNQRNDVVAQHIAANSQAFALTYLSDEYAFWYWQRAIDKYAALYRGPGGGGGGGGAAAAGGGGSSSTAAPP